MVEIKEHIQSIVTILALVNPVMCAEIFSDCVGTIPKQEKVKQATRVVTTIGIILLIAAMTGTTVLKAFGVSLDAFSCAGGGILVWIGTNMLRSAQQDTPKTGSVQSEVSSVSLTPLILFAASPGTITGVITVSAFHNKLHLPVTAIVGVVVTLAVLALLLFITIGLSREQRKPTTMKKIITSYMGVIVIAMGVQFFLSGIKAFMS